MATRSTVTAIGFSIIAIGLMSGCANHAPHPSPETVDGFCQQQGSDLGIWQCQQYYARNGFQPVSPVFHTSQASQSDMDPHDRAMLLGIMLSQPHPQPYVAPAYQMPVNRPWTTNCTRMGDFTTCNGH